MRPAFRRLHARFFASRRQRPPATTRAGCFPYLFVESVNDGLDPLHGLVRRHAQADARAAMSPINHFCDRDICARFAPLRAEYLQNRSEKQCRRRPAEEVKEVEGGGGSGLVFHFKLTPPRRHDTPPEV